jgi:hypothetical protein
MIAFVCTVFGTLLFHILVNLGKVQKHLRQVWNKNKKEDHVFIMSLELAPTLYLPARGSSYRLKSGETYI